MDVSKERFVVNGSHEGSRLQDLLDIFIKKFVLCHKCDNPETTMVRLVLFLRHLNFILFS